MIDIVDKETRSRMMAGIGAKDTKPELALRRALHARGFRYQTHAAGVPGKPDLRFPRFNAVVFVHGCFWHRHQGCRFSTNPATRPDFWKLKFAANVKRDKILRDTLLAAEIRFAIVWECALRKHLHVAMTADLLGDWLRSDATELELGESEVLSALHSIDGAY